VFLILLMHGTNMKAKKLFLKSLIVFKKKFSSHMLKFDIWTSVLTGSLMSINILNNANSNAFVWRHTSMHNWYKSRIHLFWKFASWPHCVIPIRAEIIISSTGHKSNTSTIVTHRPYTFVILQTEILYYPLL
jgi:hypothetical protein